MILFNEIDSDHIKKKTINPHSTFKKLSHTYEQSYEIDSDHTNNPQNPKTHHNRTTTPFIETIPSMILPRQARDQH